MAWLLNYVSILIKYFNFYHNFINFICHWKLLYKSKSPNLFHHLLSMEVIWSLQLYSCSHYWECSLHSLPTCPKGPWGGVFHGFECVGVFFFLIPDTTAHLKKHTVAECLTQKLNSRVMLFSTRCLFMCLVVPLQVPCALLVQEISPSSPAWRHLQEAVHSQLELSIRRQRSENTGKSQPKTNNQRLETNWEEAKPRASTSTKPRIRCERHRRVSEYPNPHTAKLTEHTLQLPAQPAL